MAQLPSMMLWLSDPQSPLPWALDRGWGSTCVYVTAHVRACDRAGIGAAWGGSGCLDEFCET